jgi:hypothetical protein
MSVRELSFAIRPPGIQESNTKCSNGINEDKQQINHRTRRVETINKSPKQSQPGIESTSSSTKM